MVKFEQEGELLVKIENCGPLIQDCANAVNGGNGGQFEITEQKLPTIFRTLPCIFLGVSKSIIRGKKYVKR